MVEPTAAALWKMNTNNGAAGHVKKLGDRSGHFHIEIGYTYGNRAAAVVKEIESFFEIGPAARNWYSLRRGWPLPKMKLSLPLK